MSEKPKCQHCGAKLQTKALTDSDQRIWAKWHYCEDCGWDERVAYRRILASMVR